MHWMYGNAWGWGLSWLFWLVVLAAVSWLVMLGVCRGFSPPKGSAEQILRERFARG